jgi:hypothetical protein
MIASMVLSFTDFDLLIRRLEVHRFDNYARMATDRMSPSRSG